MTLRALYYASPILPWVIDSLVYALIFTFLVAMVLKPDETLTKDEKEKHRKYGFILAFAMGPILTAVLYSSGLNLDILLSGGLLWIFILLFGVIILTFVMKAVFKKKKPKLDKDGKVIETESKAIPKWIWFIIPLAVFVIALLMRNFRPVAAALGVGGKSFFDILIYLGLFMFLIIVLIWASKGGKEEDKKGEKLTEEDTAALMQHITDEIAKLKEAMPKDIESKIGDLKTEFNNLKNAIESKPGISDEVKDKFEDLERVFNDIIKAKFDELKAEKDVKVAELRNIVSNNKGVFFYVKCPYEDHEKLPIKIEKNSIFPLIRACKYCKKMFFVNQATDNFWVILKCLGCSKNIHFEWKDKENIVKCPKCKILLRFFPSLVNVSKDFRKIFEIKQKAVRGDLDNILKIRDPLEFKEEGLSWIEHHIIDLAESLNKMLPLEAAKINSILNKCLKLIESYRSMAINLKDLTKKKQKFVGSIWVKLNEFEKII